MSAPAKRKVDWERLHLFRVVAEAGSFTHAGDRLNLSQSAVGRQIGTLEESLTVSLFHRHARGLVLTEEGEELFKAVQDMGDRLNEAIERMNAARGKSDGPIKITTTMAFGSGWLTSRINRFHDQYPEISVSLLLTDGPELDIFAREADVAIRFATQTHPRAIQTPLMTTRYLLFASRSYLKQYGTPQSTNDLDRHQLIAYGENISERIERNINWILDVGKPKGERRTPALSVNSVYAIYRAVRSGLGIGPLPYYSVDEPSELVQVLPELSGPAFVVYFVYSEERRGWRRIAVLRDFLIQMVEEDQRADKPVGTLPTTRRC